MPRQPLSAWPRRNLAGQIYVTQAGKHIAGLRRARPDITIEIRLCPAHKRVPGNEKADEWERGSWGESRGVEWMRFSDRSAHG